MVSLSQQQQRTVGFLKPDVVDLKTELMDLIKSNHQWKVTFEQELILSLGEAKVLYPQDNEALWLSSHPIYVFVLEGNNVVQHWLDYVGPKDPEEAKQVSPQSLRACYGLDSFYNVCHASGSNKEAQHDLIWLQGLVVDDLSIQSNPTSASSSVKSNKSQPSKLKKPTSKIGVTSATTNLAAPAGSSATTKHLSSTSNNSDASSSSSESKKKKPTQKQSMAIPRPRSALGSRPSTNTGPASKQGPQQKIPAMPSSVKIPSLKTTTATTKKPTTGTTPSQQPDTARSAVSRTSKAQATSKGRKETKPSRLGARSEFATKQSPDPVPSMGPSSSKRLSNTRGISKNTPGISVLTGRTRKNSRLEKRKDAPTLTTSPPTVTEEDPVENTTQADTNDTKDDGSLEYKVAESNKQVSGDNTNTTQMDDLSITNYGNNNNNAPYATESATSTSTSCSQHTRDSDHDAEVAATTSAARSTGVRIESPCELIDRRRSSSFSPASVASSLARPETPEVDNLRQRFESLGKSPILGATKRNSSITPEIASRIKDLKPKDPAGSRVKSMVEFFMDEKLHKWEF